MFGMIECNQCEYQIKQLEQTTYLNTADEIVYLRSLVYFLKHPSLGTAAHNPEFSFSAIHTVLTLKECACADCALHQLGGVKVKEALALA